MKANTKIGLVGLVIQSAINLIAILVFRKTSAEFFSDQWWSAWFPGYTVWLIFVILGFVIGAGKDDANKQ